MRRSIGIVLLLSCTAAAAQEMAVPVDVQVPLLLKILTFERNLRGHRSQPLRLGVLFQSQVEESREAFDAFTATAAKGPMRLGSRAIEIVPIDAADDAEVARVLGTAPIDVLYVAPLRAIAISAITKLTRQREIITLTGVPAYVDQGLSVGVDARGGRTRVVINLGAHRAEGAEFSAQLLKMARIVP